MIDVCLSFCLSTYKYVCRWTVSVDVVFNIDMINAYCSVWWTIRLLSSVDNKRRWTISGSTVVFTITLASAHHTYHETRKNNTLAILYDFFQITSQLLDTSQAFNREIRPWSAEQPTEGYMKSHLQQKVNSRQSGLRSDIRFPTY